MADPTDEKKSSGKKKIGTALIVLPIIIFAIVAAANRFSISHPWLGSAKTDLYLGILGVISVVVGFILSATAKKK